MLAFLTALAIRIDCAILAVGYEAYNYSRMDRVPHDEAVSEADSESWQFLAGLHRRMAEHGITANNL